IKIRLGSSSLKLLQEVQLLLNDFGVKSSIALNTRRGTPVGKAGKDGKIYKSKHDSYTLNIIGFDSYQKFCKEIGFLDMKKQERAVDYLGKTCGKPPNSPGIFLIPHPTKNEMVDEKRLGMEYPFSVAAFKGKEDMESDAEVYDLEIEDVSMFSGNGIFVHNSMFGYATNETPSMMPLSIDLAHRLTRRMAEVRRSGALKWVRPDGKSQVTVEYVNGKPKRVDTVVIAIQHDPDIEHEGIRHDVIEHIIRPVCGRWLDADTKFIVNHSGRFVIGGPPGDTGVTGRKIIVDTYGGHGSHGGGCLSGKDPSKVDRSASYMARHIAKNIVAAGLADRCEVQIAYALGFSKPVSLMISTDGTGSVPDGKIEEAVRRLFDLRPKAIIDYLDLRRPIFEKTAAYGHFGRDDPDFTWERTHRAGELRKACGL
ncbi:MAG: methionine adenosyltransferase, partial [Candidatus Aenigmarchaeota archaeon]|nr:methionine adenosyltransferase [Candidatus Aenigmarchaeota archaeon]